MIYNGDVPGRILPRFTMDIKRRHKCDVNVAVFGHRGEIPTSLSRYMRHLIRGTQFFVDPRYLHWYCLDWFVEWSDERSDPWFDTRRWSQPSKATGWKERRAYLNQNWVQKEGGLQQRRENKSGDGTHRGKTTSVDLFILVICAASHPIPGTRWRVIVESSN